VRSKVPAATYFITMESKSSLHGFVLALRVVLNVHDISSGRKRSETKIGLQVVLASASECGGGRSCDLRLGRSIGNYDDTHPLTVSICSSTVAFCRREVL
jgi:hypothetical protein